MEQKERRRSTGKVDRLPPELKDTVEQMLLTGCTYKEIVTFLKENGEEMSQMANLYLRKEVSCHCGDDNGGTEQFLHADG